LAASVDKLRLSCSLRPQKIAQSRTRRTNSPLFRSALMLSRGGVESLKDILRPNSPHIQLSCTRAWATNTSSVEYLILLFILFVGPGQYALLRSKVEPVILSEADLIRVGAGQGFCFSLPGSRMPSQPRSKAAPVGAPDGSQFSEVSTRKSPCCTSVRSRGDELYNPNHLSC
jgi:hypothetical protein